MESLNESFVSLHWQKGKRLTVVSWLVVILTFSVLGLSLCLHLTVFFLLWPLLWDRMEYGEEVSLGGRER